MSQRYRKPPIVEAVIAISVRQAVSEDLLDKVHRRLLEDYPAPVARIRPSQFEIEIGEAGRAKIKSNESLPGYRLTAADGAGIVVMLPDLLATSRMAPYEGWEPFFARARQNWDTWKRVVEWREIVRVGVRYINRIDIPTESEPPIISLEEYLDVSPRLPRLGRPMTHFAVNTESALGTDNCKLILNVGSTPSPLVKTASFILDIDIVVDTNLPQNDNELWALIGRMRVQKNTVFEACITDKLRALFT